MVNSNYNPDVLNCIANLSNDEVFTPPELANRVLDLLPQDLFKSPDTKFLDPFSKSGVFLREIVKRLDRGLESLLPDRQLRIDHILHNQVFGIAITELTTVFLISIQIAATFCTQTAPTPGKTANVNTAVHPRRSMTEAPRQSNMPICSSIQTIPSNSLEI